MRGTLNIFPRTATQTIHSDRSNFFEDTIFDAELLPPNFVFQERSGLFGFS